MCYQHLIFLKLFKSNHICHVIAPSHRLVSHFFLDKVEFLNSLRLAHSHYYRAHLLLLMIYILSSYEKMQLLLVRLSSIDIRNIIFKLISDNQDACRPQHLYSVIHHFWTNGVSMIFTFNVLLRYCVGWYELKIYLFIDNWIQKSIMYYTFRHINLRVGSAYFGTHCICNYVLTT